MQQQARGHVLVGGVAVQVVARHSVADGLHMHANLVGTARFRCQFNKGVGRIGSVKMGCQTRVLGARRHYAPASAAGFAVCGVNDAAGAVGPK